MDFLWPSGGRTGGGRLAEDSRFSLLSSDGAVSVSTAGEAGMVLKRFFSGTVAFLSDVDDSGLVRVVEAVAEREEGVVGILRVPDGLVTEERDPGVAGFLAGVEGVVLLEVDVLSALIVGASDILLGFADMPSSFLSSAASTELAGTCLRSDGVKVGVAVDAGLLAVETLGRAGGLPSAGDGDDLDTEVAVGLDKVEVRGATGLVSGLFGGIPALMLEWLVFSSVRDGTLSAIVCTWRCDRVTEEVYMQRIKR